MSDLKTHKIGGGSAALVDLLDRLLDVGAVIAGDIVISVADVDLVYLNLRLLVASAATAGRGAAS